jgi:NADH-quinone oxidoreductase subunit A
MNPYVIFLLYLIAILGFVGVMLLANKLLGPKPAMTAIKQEPFECGATLIDTREVHTVPVKYYAVAIVFILFDLETILLILWALGAQPLDGFMLATFGFFMFMLMLVLAYVYRAGLLNAVTD